MKGTTLPTQQNVDQDKNSLSTAPHVQRDLHMDSSHYNLISNHLSSMSQWLMIVDVS